MLGRDVTEQREKEMRFTELFETLQEGVYFSTPEGQLLDANPALVSMLGYVEKGELLAAEPATLNFDPGQPVLGRAVDDRGGVRTREIKLRRKDGTAAVFLDSSRAVWDASGNIIRYQGTLVDITEKRKHGAATGAAGRVPQPSAGELSGPDSGGGSGGTVHVCEFAGARSAGLRTAGDAGKEDFRDWKIIRRRWPRCITTVVSGKQAFASAEYGARHRDGSWRTMRASGSQLVDCRGKDQRQ